MRRMWYESKGSKKDRRMRYFGILGNAGSEIVYQVERRKTKIVWKLSNFIYACFMHVSCVIIFIYKI